MSSHAPGGRHTDHSGPQTRRSVEASLKLLRTDYLDSVLIHGYDHITDPETVDDFVDPLAPGNALDELIKMKQQGHLRHIGIGARTPEVQRRAIETGEIEILLPYQPVAKVCDFLRAIMTCLSLPLSMNLLREMRSWR